MRTAQPALRRAEPELVGVSINTGVVAPEWTLRNSSARYLGNFLELEALGTSMASLISHRRSVGLNADEQRADAEHTTLD